MACKTKANREKSRADRKLNSNIKVQRSRNLHGGISHHTNIYPR